MTFFQDQIAARHKSRNLIWLYSFAVLTTVLATSTFLTALFAGAKGQHTSGEVVAVFLLVVVVISAIILLGTSYKLWLLQRGGVVIAEMLGGRRILSNSRDGDERRVLNVVEEVAIASGVTVPAVFIIDNERGINAFAAGLTPKDAVVGVTIGAVKLLSRDELQGVIAHEFSHIFNGDMAMNMRLVGWLHGITVMALLGYFLCRSLRYTRNSGKNQQFVLAIFLIGLVLAIVGYIGMFFASLIKSAVSRQREYLADASAVQYTRNPSGLAGALKKIARLAEGALLGNPRALEASHFFFAAGVKNGIAELFATHPPLMTRIKKLDPHFKGDLEKLSFKEAELLWVAGQSSDIERQEVVESQQRKGPVPVGRTWQPGIGEIGPAQLGAAVALLEAMPKKLDFTVHDPFGARAVICGLLLDGDSNVLSRQLEILDSCSDPVFKREVLALHQSIIELSASYHLSLVALSIPALALLPQPQYQEFIDLIEELVMVDKRISLFEHAVEMVVRDHVGRIRGAEKRQNVRYQRVEEIKDKLIRVIGALAHFGNADDDGAAMQAFQAGLAAIGWVDQKLAEKDMKAHFTWEEFEAGISVLQQSAVEVREIALAAFLATIVADRAVTEEEQSLFRIVGISLDCPVSLPSMSSN